MAKRTLAAKPHLVSIGCGLIFLAFGILFILSKVGLLQGLILLLAALYIGAPRSPIWKCKHCAAILPRAHSSLGGCLKGLVIFFAISTTLQGIFVGGLLLWAMAEENSNQPTDTPAQPARRAVPAAPQIQPEPRPEPAPRLPEPEPEPVEQPDPLLIKMTEWTDKRGRKLQAELLSVTDGKGLFRRPTGETFEYSIEDLSPDDVELIEFALERRGKGKG